MTLARYLHRLLFVALLGLAGPVWAASLDIEPLFSRFEADDARLAELVKQRGALGSQLSQRAETIANLKQAQVAKPGVISGYGLERELRAFQRDSDTIQSLDASIQALRQGLDKSARQILRRCDELLPLFAGGANPVAQATAGRLQAIRLRVQGFLAAAATAPAARSVADVIVHPLDGPEELLEKAGVLGDARDKIRAQLAQLENHYKSLHRKLRVASHVRDRKFEQNLWDEESSSMFLPVRRAQRTAAKVAETPKVRDNAAKDTTEAGAKAAVPTTVADSSGGGAPAEPAGPSFVPMNAGARPAPRLTTSPVPAPPGQAPSVSLGTPVPEIAPVAVGAQTDYIIEMERFVRVDTTRMLSDPAYSAATPENLELLRDEILRLRRFAADLTRYQQALRARAVANKSK